MKTVIIEYRATPAAEDDAGATRGSESGKFLQIINDDTEYLLFSPRDLTPYHSDLLERFSGEKGIKGSFDSERKRFNIGDASWRVVGGGKFDIDPVSRSVRLYDDSMAYGKFDPAGLKEKVLRIKGLAGYRVIIE